jgi:hypothetical protein
MHHDFPFFFWLSPVLTSSALIITGPLCAQLVRFFLALARSSFVSPRLGRFRKSPFHSRRSNFRGMRESFRCTDRYQGVDDTFVLHRHHGLNHPS